MLLLITLSEGLAAIDAVRVDALAPRRSALTALAAIFPLAAFGRAEVSDRVGLKNDAARGAPLAFGRSPLGRVIEDWLPRHEVGAFQILLQTMALTRGCVMPNR